MSFQDIIDKEKARRDGMEADAQRARDLTEAVLDPTRTLARHHAPQDLLAAAQVYATLATRRY